MITTKSTGQVCPAHLCINCDHWYPDYANDDTNVIVLLSQGTKYSDISDRGRCHQCDRLTHETNRCDDWEPLPDYSEEEWYWLNYKASEHSTEREYSLAEAL